jgi:hypothetical protein
MMALYVLTIKNGTRPSKTWPDNMKIVGSPAT